MKTFMPPLYRVIALGREHRKALALATRYYCFPWKAGSLSIIQNNLCAMETAVVKASTPWWPSLAFAAEGPILHVYMSVCVQPLAESELPTKAQQP